VVPSHEAAAKRMLELSLELGALRFGTFTLSSGQTSTYYFDGRLLSLSPEGASLIARVLLPMVRESGAEAVGGPTLGADPMVAAIALLSYQDGGRPIPAFIVRKQTKEHGLEQLIEGPLPRRARVAIVDDACSTGESLRHAVRALPAERSCRCGSALATALVTDRKLIPAATKKRLAAIIGKYIS